MRTGASIDVQLVVRSSRALHGSCKLALELLLNAAAFEMELAGMTGKAASAAKDRLFDGAVR